MTGFSSDKFRYNCATSGCYNDSLPDWSDVNACFPGAIRPTDIDGMVEINGRVLFIEQKARGKSIERGQVLAFQRLSLKQSVTVVAVREGDVTELQMLVYRNGHGDSFKDVTRPDFLAFLRLWADNAINAVTEVPWVEQVLKLQEEVALLQAENKAMKLEYYALGRSKGMAS